MFTRKRLTAAAVVISSLALALSGCGTGGAGTGTSGAGPQGEPVKGGVGRVLQITEPRSLDPALLQNSTGAGGEIVGNALYGTLMINDASTSGIKFSMAKDFSSVDGGRTFTLTLRDGLVFSDGTPLAAQDVKYNWDRVRDPTTRSPGLPQAALVARTDVVDDKTLRVTMAEPTPSFAQVVAATSLNWIGKPDVLRAGQRTVDSNPVGAGPYVLEKWARQDVIELARNGKFWDAPKPYLDRLEIRIASDTAQRYNTVSSGAADLAAEAEWVNLAKAERAGLQRHEIILNGGAGFVMNTSRPPFDDPRARKAVALALDLDAFNQVIFQGSGIVPRTLFADGSPFYRDLSLNERDPKQAQALFDEMAAEGRPLSFTFTVFSTTQGRATADIIQTQLSAFRNVHIEIEFIEIAEIALVNARGDFQMGVGGSTFVDPEPQLRLSFQGGSTGNFSRIDDPQLNAALQAGRSAQNEQERAAAYEIVQRRLIELKPIIFYSRNPQGVVANKNIGGIHQYGNGSIIPEELWRQS